VLKASVNGVIRMHAKVTHYSRNVQRFKLQHLPFRLDGKVSPRVCRTTGSRIPADGPDSCNDFPADEANSAVPLP